jgi:eukaryotic-like serine/threonine-protein kinase
VLCPLCRAVYEDGVTRCPADGTALVDASGPLPSNRLRPGSLLGSHRIVKSLGSGGMGVVYEAEHVRVKRRVAIKVLRPQCAADPKMVQRFFAEARAANEVGHENVVEVSDFVEEEGRCYYVMELLQGRALADELREGKPLPLRRVFRIGTQVASALHAVHVASIVHRDLKPANIFLTTRAGQTDFVKLFDFGIAKLRSDKHVETQAGTLIGTPAFWRPSRFAGRASTRARTSTRSA